MRQTVHAGKALEIPSGAEIQDLIRRELVRRRPRTIRGAESGGLDAAGFAVIPVYTVPAGMTFNLHRLTIDADGFTPAAPYTNAAGYVDILRGDERLDFFSLAPGVGSLPAVFTSGQADAIRYQNNEVAALRIVAGPGSGKLIVRFQGTLEPLVDD